MTETSKRDRSPSFPYIGPSKALQRIEVLFAKVKRHDARVSDIAKDWGLAPKSSSTDRTVAALLAYGLVEEAGGTGDLRKIRISEAGWRILEDARPGVSQGLLAQAARRPKIIEHYAALWRQGRPDDDHALSQLKFESGFTDDGARNFLRVYDDASRFLAMKAAPGPALASDPQPPPPVQATLALDFGASRRPSETVPAETSAPANVIRVLLDGERLQVSADVDLNGARRLLKALAANIAVLEEQLIERSDRP